MGSSKSQAKCKKDSYSSKKKNGGKDSKNNLITNKDKSSKQSNQSPIKAPHNREQPTPKSTTDKIIVPTKPTTPKTYTSTLGLDYDSQINSFKTQANSEKVKITNNLEHVLNTLKKEYEKIETNKFPTSSNSQNQKNTKETIDSEELTRFARDISKIIPIQTNPKFTENLGEIKKKIDEVLKNKFMVNSVNINKVNVVSDAITALNVKDNHAKPPKENTTTIIKPPIVINNKISFTKNENKNNFKRSLSDTVEVKVSTLKSSSSKSSSLTSTKMFPYSPSFVQRDDLIKNMREKVDTAIKNHNIFTVNGNYYSIRRSLTARGWLEKLSPNFTPSNCDSYLLRNLQFMSIPELFKGLNDKEGSFLFKQRIFSKMIGSATVSLIWDLNKEKFRENPDFYKNSMLNFITKTRFNYANKEGLAHSSKEAHWVNQPGVSRLSTPRSYSLNTKEDPEEFIYDFKVTAAVSLLKWIVNIHESHASKLISESGKVPIAYFHFALQECIKFIKRCKHEDVDRDFEPAAESTWQEFLDYFHMAVHVGNHFRKNFEESEVSLVHKSKTMLKKIKEVCPYVEMDGYMNIWILKPSYGSRGIGIHFCRTLQYILKIIKEKKSAGYVIQKYIERPLLIHNTKFDIRQWFLVSSTTPITIWIYKECYLRFSSQTYNLRKLHESIHLTNNSVQSKYHNGNRDPALPSHNMWYLHEFKDHLASIGYPKVYDEIIYPGMKECITGAIIATDECIIPREKSFELHGADFMITEDFKPWLIEINSKPALNPSTPVTSKMCPAVLEDVIKVVIDHAKNPLKPTGKFELLYKQELPRLPINKKLRLDGIPLTRKYFLTEDQELELESIKPQRSQSSIQCFNIIKKSEYLKYVGWEMKSALKQLLFLINQEKQRRKNVNKSLEVQRTENFVYSEEIREIKSNINTIEELFRSSRDFKNSSEDLQNKFSKQSLNLGIKAISKMLVKASDAKLKTNYTNIEKALNCKRDNDVANNVISIFDSFTNNA